MPTTIPPLTPLPTPVPQTSDPANFDVRADAFLTALPTFDGELNAIVVAINTLAGELVTIESETEDARDAAVVAQGLSEDARDAAVVAQGLSEDARDAAVVAAGTASNAANVAGTSASSVTLPATASGSRTLTYVETSRQIYVGMYLLVADTANPTLHSLVMQVTAWNPGTKVVTGDVLAVTGAGTYSAWTLSLTGKPGPAGADAYVGMPERVVGAAGSITSSDRGTILRATGSYTLTCDTPAALGNDFSVMLDATPFATVISGTFIDGSSSKTLGAGAGGILHSNGTGLGLTVMGSSTPGKFHVSDQKAAGTAGGVLPATSGARTLQTTKTNTIAGASLATNQMTLPVGTFDVFAYGISKSGISLFRHYLYNVTDATEVISGSASGSTSSGFVIGRVTLAAPKVFELRVSRPTGTPATDDGGLSNGSGVNIYAEVIFQQVF